MKQLQRVLFAAIVLSALVSVGAEEPNRAPVIGHEPVTVAVRDQPITILARVTDDSGYVKSVTLFYSPSKDAAPFRAAMKTSGAGTYFGTIPASMVSGIDSISYYIEALDYVDAAEETPWYTIELKDPAAEKPVVAQPRPVVVTDEDGEPQEQREGSRLLGVGIIAGGAAAVVGGALLFAGNDDDDGGSSSGDVQAVQPGEYEGSVTLCSSLATASPSCDRRSMVITIGENGNVFSDTLREGVMMEGRLSGNGFILVAAINDTATGEKGQVEYYGTVTGTRISGEIGGRSTSAEGEIDYSGAFSAVKR